MKNDMISVGLDIGTTKVVVMVGRKNADGTTEIIGMGQCVSTGVDKGAIQNISKTIAAIKEAVAMAENTSGVKINKVTVGIAGQYIRSARQTEYIVRPNAQEVITHKDIELLTKNAASLPISEYETILHVLPQEYKVDSQEEILDPEGMFGKRLEATFHIVIGQITPLQNVKRCVEGAGLSLCGVKLEPMASSDAVLTDDEKEAGVVMVDIGGGTTKMVIVHEGLVRHSAVLPYGGNIITDDITKACGILKRYAEKLKKEYGSTWPGENSDTDVVSIPVIAGYPEQEISLKDLSKVIYGRMDEIMDDINAEIISYRKDEPGKNLIGGIVITGGGSLLRHMPQFVRYKTGMNCRVGVPNIYLSEENADCITNPMYATCVGLVLGAPKDEYVEQVEQDTHFPDEQNEDDIYNPYDNDLEQKTSSNNEKEKSYQEQLDKIEEQQEEEQGQEDEQEVPQTSHEQKKKSFFTFDRKISFGGFGKNHKKEIEATLDEQEQNEESYEEEQEQKEEKIVPEQQTEQRKEPYSEPTNQERMPNKPKKPSKAEVYGEKLSTSILQVLQKLGD
ncbi:MAG: cell division protein FtsA [Flavobacteriales bacterium]|nr:cell division protein FtsA [Flavobacteriales bacterium]